MNVPSGYTALDLIGFTDRDDYSSIANYVKNDLVHYNGRVWKCLIDDTTGITPVEGANWTVWIDEAAYLSGLADVTITNPANGQVIRYNSQNGKWENVGVDSTPTSGSANLVQSGGVATQLANKANSADLATVATSGDYQDLNNLPTLADVATTGQYSDLLGLPTIPTVNNGTLTLQINGVTVETFNANDSNNKTANFNVPTKTSDLTNDSNFVSDANYQHITVDSAFSDTSTNPVQNKVVTSLKETLTQQINANDAKNLALNSNYTRADSGVTFTKNSDGSVSLSGASTTAHNLYYCSDGTLAYNATSLKGNIKLTKGNTYIFSSDGSTDNAYGVASRVNAFVYNVNGSGAFISSTDSISNRTFTVTTDDEVSIGIFVNKGTTVDNYHFFPMIRLVSNTDPTYAPPAKTNQQLAQETTGLIDNQNVNGAVNLLNPVLESQVVYGITVTNNGNGSYTLNGSSGNSTGSIFFTGALKLKANYSYKGVAFISGGMITSSTGSPSYSIDNRSGTQYYKLMKLNTEADQIIVTPAFTINVDVTNYRCGIWVPTNTTFNNVIVKPMVILASITDYTFVPYAKSNKELTKDVGDLISNLYLAKILLQPIPAKSSITITFNVSDRFILTITHSNLAELAYMGFGGAGASNCNLINVTTPPSNFNIVTSNNTIIITNNSNNNVNLAMIDFNGNATIS